jgi:hypothetical protein
MSESKGVLQGPKKHIEPPINADKRRSTNSFQSAFIGVHRRLSLSPELLN